MEIKDLALVSAQDLSLVHENALNEKQLNVLLRRTPQKYIHSRPAKGGGTWDYVSGGYVKKVLNIMFGWDWDFEIISELVQDGEAIVKGKLTVRTNGKTIVKTQYGNKDIICKKGTNTPLSLGNDLKSAATDCLKKCAAELGIAADIYNKMDFKEVQVKQDEAPTKEDKEAERLSQLMQECVSGVQLSEYRQTASELGMMKEYVDNLVRLKIIQ
jgi:hypothetical protein